MGSRARGRAAGGVVSHGCTGLGDSGTGRLGGGGGHGGALDPSLRDRGDLDTGHRRHPPAVCARRGCPGLAPSSKRLATRASGLGAQPARAPLGCHGSGWVMAGVGRGRRSLGAPR